jgi:hypothetical protein
MASTDARPIPKKNVAYRHYFAIRKNDGTLITTWTGQDSEVDKDGAGFSDCTNEATEIGTTGVGYLELTSTEMNADAVNVKITVTNTDALPYVVTLFPEEAGDVRVDVTQLGGDTQSATDLKDFADAGYDPATNKVQGVVLVDALTTYTGNTPQTGDAYAIVNSGTHGNAALKSLIDAVDLVVDAILVDTGTDIPATLVTIAGYIDTEVGTLNTNLNALITTVGVAGAGLTAADDAVLAAIAALNNLSAAQVNAEVLDVLNVDTLVDGKTIAQALIYCGAGIAGRVSGAGTGTEVFLGLDESTTRLTVTVDTSGNRTDVLYG